MDRAIGAYSLLCHNSCQTFGNAFSGFSLANGQSHWRLFAALPQQLPNFWQCFLRLQSGQWTELLALIRCPATTAAKLLAMLSPASLFLVTCFSSKLAAS
jgi:hypothetical protein